MCVLGGVLLMWWSHSFPRVLCQPLECWNPQCPILPTSLIYSYTFNYCLMDMNLKFVSSFPDRAHSLNFRAILAPFLLNNSRVIRVRLHSDKFALKHLFYKLIFVFTTCIQSVTIKSISGLETSISLNASISLNCSLKSFTQKMSEVSTLKSFKFVWLPLVLTIIDLVQLIILQDSFGKCL